MRITAISKDDTLLYKGVGILLIVLHNFFHWIAPSPGENEWVFNPDYIINLQKGLIEQPLECINLLFSYFGHYGIQIFIFISAVGLALSMQNRNRSWGVFMAERLKKLYPLLLVGFIFIFVANIIMNQSLLGWASFKIFLQTLLFLNTLIPGIWGGITCPWWFFGLIFQLYVLFPLLYKMIKKYRFKAFACICVISYAWMYVSAYFFPYPETSVMLFQNAPGHLPEFALGILIALSPGKRLHPVAVLSSLVIFALGNFFKPFFPFTFLSASILIYWTFSKLMPLMLNSVKKLKPFLLFYGTISYIIFAIHGPLRPPFIIIGGDIFWGKLLSAALFLITVTALAIIGNMFYKWMLKKSEVVFSRENRIHIGVVIAAAIIIASIYSLIVLNLLALLLVAVIATSFCKNRWLKTFVSAIFGIFICMQLTSLYAGDSFCDYRFFVHFNFRDFWWGATTVFKFEVWLLPVLLIGIIAGIFYLSIYLSFLRRDKRLLLFVKLALTAFSLFVLIVPKNGIVDNLRKVYILYSMPESDNFDDIFKTVIKITGTNISSEHITKKEELKVSAEGKNIVVISLESFNRAYFLDKNQHLVPNLRRLKQQWNYYPMFEHSSAGWTVASLYTTLTGLPTLFPGIKNRFFESTKTSRHISLIDVLKKAGYETHFLSDDAEFASTQDLLTTFGVHHIWDKTLNGKYSEKMKDAELFIEAKNILQDSTRTKPAIIYISTLATHCPNGFPDPQLYDRVELQKSPLETAAAQTDYLVGDFVDFLKQNDYLENTVVYIFPDHPFMGKPAILKTKEEAKLWFLTNADSEDLFIDTKNFYQIDLPRNILSGAKVKHNTTFLSDFIKENKSQFIDKNAHLLSALNAAHIEREGALDNNLEVALVDEYVIGSIGNDTLFIDHIDILSKYERFIFLTNELRVENVALFESGYLDLDSVCYNLYVKVGVKNDLLDVTWERNFGSKKTLPATTHLKMNHASIKKTLNVITPKINITRAEENPNDSLLLDYLPKILQDPSKTVIVFCYDEASVHFAKLNPILEQVGLKESLVDCFRCSYIAVFSKNRIYFEKVGGQEIIHKKLTIGGVGFCVFSGGFGNWAGEIAINNENYAQFLRGLNFLIFNTKDKRIEDFFNVDFHGDETLRINRL